MKFETVIGRFLVEKSEVGVSGYDEIPSEIGKFLTPIDLPNSSDIFPTSKDVSNLNSHSSISDSLSLMGSKQFWR